MGSDGVFAAMAALRAAHNAFAATDLSMLTVDEKFAVYDEYETLTRQLAAQSHRVLAGLMSDTGPRDHGAKTWNEVLRTRWRLSTGEAGRRIAEAADLAPRRSVTGPPLPPKLPAIAAAQWLGFLPAEHVKLLHKTMDKDLPHWIDDATRAQVEVDLVRAAVGQGYTALHRAIRIRLAQLDQDGPDPEALERERRRKRSARTGKQGADLLTALTVNMDPELAAMVEVLFAKLAAPGMCNPDDEHPCLDGTPTQAQIDNDHRTLEQRQHDALKVALRIVLMSDLGKLNGLPVSIIIRTTLQDLESRGIAVTGGGTLMTMNDVDRLGGHAAYHLCVFDGVTGSAINHFRSKRVATAEQRAMLIAQHGVGCTKPGCTVTIYGAQAHHAVHDWADNGQTNVDEMAPACGGDNRLVGPGEHQYTTSINDHGICEWTPPPHLDTGQDRINLIHRPEALLAPAEGVDDAAHTWPPAPPVVDPAPPVDTEGDDTDDEPFSIWDYDAAAARAAATATDNDDDEPFNPWADDTEDEFWDPADDDLDDLDDTLAVVLPVVTDPDAPIRYTLIDDNRDEFIAPETVFDNNEAVGYGDPSRGSPHRERSRRPDGPAPPA